MPRKTDANVWHMLTVVGADRPGIVAGMTELLYRAGCNLGEARMARLGGNFSIMLMVQGGQAPALQAALTPAVETFGLHFHIDPIRGQLHQHQQPNVQIIVHGADRPGIVAQVTGVLAEAGCNILDLNSDVAGSDAQPIYIMVIEALATGGADSIDSALESIRRKGIEVRVMPLDTLIG